MEIVSLAQVQIFEDHIPTRYPACDTLLADGVFYNVENHPYCARCSSSGAIPTSTKCTECRQVINAGSTFVEYGGLKFHEHCFKCTGCKKVLNPEAFYDLNGAVSIFVVDEVVMGIAILS
jgi:hypothetical protein